MTATPPPSEGDGSGSSHDPADRAQSLRELLAEEGLDSSTMPPSGETAGEESDELSALFAENPPSSTQTQETVVPPAGPSRSAVPGRRNRTVARAVRRAQERSDYQALEARMQMDRAAVEVSEDRLTATLSRIRPEDTYEEILDLLRRHGIAHGIDHEAIRSAVARASHNGKPVFKVVVARGTPPQIVEEPRIVYHIPCETGPSRSSGSLFQRLRLLLEGEDPKTLHGWKEPVQLVRSGDVLAEISPAQTRAGKDVLGETLPMPPPEAPSLEAGDHTELTDDGSRVISSIYGYAGFIEGVPTVLPPIWVAPDSMEARFVILPTAEDIAPPTQEELQQLMDLLWISYGVMEKQLALLGARIAQGKSVAVTVPFARGTPEVPGQHAQIRHAFDIHAVPPWNQIQSLLSLPSPVAMTDALKEAFTVGTCPPFTAFRHGETVVEKIPPSEGTAGKDIRGEEVIPEEGKDVDLEVGDHLDLVEDGTRAVAGCFGYVALRHDIQVTLLPPVWVSPDKTTAYFLNLPQTHSPKFPSLEEMQDLLEAMGITHGFSPEAWKKTLVELESGRLKDFLVPVALGTQATPGRDAVFEWAVKIVERRPGRILEDGSIDYRDRNTNTLVRQGDRIGRLIPPRPGVPGLDVFGNEIKPQAPVNIEVITDSRVYAEPEEDGSITFLAEIDGGVEREIRDPEPGKRRHRRLRISVSPVSTIDGDVDFSSGNVDFNGDVMIGGSVRSQFSVRATGNVTIGEYVESGAYVTAGGDIVVKRGILGAHTELVAGGHLQAKYVQEASIRTGGDVKVGAYIFNASVRARGRVVVAGKAEGKSRALVGGMVWGALGITARSVGSPYNTSTRLVVGVDPGALDRADQIRANLAACEAKQHKLLQEIGIEVFDLGVMKARVGRARDSAERQRILAVLRRVSRLAELQQSIESELHQIAESQRELALKASIDVQREIFAGVEMRIGELTRQVHETESNATYQLLTEGNELVIGKVPFRSKAKS